MKSIFPHQYMVLLTAGMIALSSSSCKKFLDLPASPEMIETGHVFTNEQTATAAVLGVYNQMRIGTDFTNGGLSIYGSLAADDLRNTAANATNDAFSKNALLPNTSAVNTNFWTAAYKNVYRTNAVLEGLSEASITPSLKNTLAGEMKLTRALSYFYLVNLFGPVPLVQTTDYNTNALLPRTGADSIYRFIMADLSGAKDLLPTAYTTAGKARPNKWTAAALLARVYLYTGQWAAAEAEATAVIQAGIYSLAPVNSTFLAASPETIWELASDNAPTSEGFRFVASSATVRPTYALTAALLDTFENGDRRKTSWTKTNTVGGTPYTYPYKYRQRLGTPVTEYDIVIRLAEFYLLRAEARAQLNLPGAVADLNTIRQRAGLPDYAGPTDKASMLAAIEQERQVEFFAEWGHRWLDLKRTGRADAVLQALKGADWQPTDTLFPIPQTELDRNAFLTQNPGY